MIEHVLRVAQETYEERKLPYVAAALANIATDPTIDERTAHRLLSELERANWPKLVALAAVRSRESSPLLTLKRVRTLPSGACGALTRSSQSFTTLINCWAPRNARVQKACLRWAGRVSATSGLPLRDLFWLMERALSGFRRQTASSC